MSINIILYQAVFQQIYLQYCFDSYTFLFRLFSSDLIKVFMSVCPTVSKLRFYGCCHPCLVIFRANPLQNLSPHNTLCPSKTFSNGFSRQLLVLEIYKMVFGIISHNLKPKKKRLNVRAASPYCSNFNVQFISPLISLLCCIFFPKLIYPLAQGGGGGSKMGGVGGSNSTVKIMVLGNKVS